MKFKKPNFKYEWEEAKNRKKLFSSKEDWLKIAQTGTIEKINCSSNQISVLDKLPQTLITLICFNNQISALHKLPQSLKILDCSFNKIITLDKLPQYLEILNCSENEIYYI